MVETVIGALERAVNRWGSVPAFKEKRDGQWHATSWWTYGELLDRTARGLIALGLEPGKGVSIIGYNRPEWFLADIGAILAGGIPAGIYTTCSADQCQYVAHHSEAQVAVVENAEQLAKLTQVREQLPHLKAIVVMEGPGDAEDESVYAWQEMLDAGAEVSDEALHQRKAAQQPDDVCTLIYTSGTTGPPKAVMMTHRNFIWTARTLHDHVGGLAAGDAGVSYLPLSHVAEQLLALHLPMTFGGTVYFERVLERLGDTLREARPAVFLGVPRVWEKIQAKIVAGAAKSSPLKRKIGLWAKGVGLAAGYAEQRRGSKPLLYLLADKLVFSKVKLLLGLDRCQMAVTSTAPIARDTLEFFLSLGIPICEVYGMSECTGPATLCTPARYRTGKAGYALPGAEIKIAEDGEICIRGPHVFKGYYKDEAATAEALDEEGWLRSGDIGTLDAEGFLQVTGRKKELIITAGGKNISPTLIEGLLKALPVIAQAVVIGDRRKFISALVTLDAERVVAEARGAGISGVVDVASAAANTAFQAHVMGLVSQACESLSRAEAVKKIAILPGELTEQGGELTPTLKLKRRVIHDKYAGRIDSIYA